jgi:hypothetical protein
MAWTRVEKWWNFEWQGKTGKLLSKTCLTVTPSTENVTRIHLVAAVKPVLSHVSYGTSACRAEVGFTAYRCVGDVAVALRRCC